MKYLALIFLLAACGESQKTDPAFSPYIQEINQDLNGHLNIKSTIVFGTPGPRFEATCFQENSVIIVDQEKWKDMTHEQRYWVLLHEIGHCELSLEDSELLGPNGLPTTFMFNPSIQIGLL